MANKKIIIIIILVIVIVVFLGIENLGYQSENEFLKKNDFMYLEDTDQYMYYPDSNNAIAISTGSVVFINSNSSGVAFDTYNKEYVCVKNVIIPTKCKNNSYVINQFRDDKVAKNTYKYYNLGEYTPVLAR